MKLTEQKCPACNGTLKIDEKNPHIAECEYCRSRYIVEWDHDLAHIGGRMEQPDGKAADQSGRKGARWLKGILLLAVIAVIWVLWSSLQERQDGGNLRAENDGREESTADKAADAGNMVPTGILADFCETVFQMPIEAVSDAQIEEIRWLELRSTMDYQEVGFSMESPIENPQAELTWVKFPRDDYRRIDLKSLPAFKGIEKLSVNQSLEPENLAGLPLKSIGGYFESIQDITELLEHPEEIVEIQTSGSTFSLNGLAGFPKLESLSINGEKIEEERELVQASNLKKLQIDLYDGTMDFTVFSMMPWLEELDIRSQELRDISFLSDLTALRSLEVEDGTFLDLEALRSRPQLESLSIVSCDELKDMSAVGSLTALKQLRLEVPYGCQEPDLGGLTNIEELYLENFTQTEFLRSMPGLARLTLDGCQGQNPEDFAGLSSLKSLTCTAFGHSEGDYSFVTALPALEQLDLHGMSTYSDISRIFNMPSLKSLNISDMECEINFANIGENTTLEELFMDRMTLYKNVQVSFDGAITYVDWDTVNFADQVGELAKLKGLKKLSIQGNQLTDLEFASSLKTLVSIDFSDNYVTDLEPLVGLTALKEVSCRENPISNYEVLKDSVVVLSDTQK